MKSKKSYIKNIIGMIFVILPIIYFVLLRMYNTWMSETELLYIYHDRYILGIIILIIGAIILDID